MKEYDVIIIGGGPAGLSAALSARKHGAKRIAIIDRLPYLGGILKQCFHTGFGLNQYGVELTGVEYASRLVAEVEDTDIEVFTDTSVISLDINRIITTSGRHGVIRISGATVILASGCRESSIGSLPIYGTRPAGVFTAGLVQKMINLYGYRVGSSVVVLGSGDVGMIVAHHLTQCGAHVEGVFEIKNHMGGLRRNKKRYLDTHDIPLITGSTVTKLHGQGRLSAITVCQVDKDLNPIQSSEKIIPCDTLVTSVGLIPELELLEGLSVQPNKTPGVTATCLPWLFICGNAHLVHSLVDSVIIEGHRAGQSCAEYVEMSD